MRAATICCILAGCALSTKPPSPPRHTTLGLDISMSVLPNGLRVVLVHDARAPEVSLTMRYRVGAIDDGVHPGIAHMAEHLMYQQSVGNASLFAQLEQSTTYFNGATTYDSTTYISRAPRAELDHLLSIEGLRMQLRCTTITDAVFERERAVVINEIRQRDDSDQLRSAIHSAVYPGGHPYLRSIGGTEETLSALTRQDVCAFVDAHYAPENAVLVVSGNLTGDELVASLQKLVGRIPRRAVAAPGYVPALSSEAVRGDAAAPLDDEALLVTWPLPVDPRLRTQVRAIAAALPALLNYQIAGSVATVELGDEGAQVVGIVAVAASDESPWKVKEKIESTIVDLSDIFDPKWRVSELDQIGFDNVRQSAIYRLYASLELPDVRDQMLAGFALAGRDPGVALSEEFDGLRELTPATARELVTRYLSMDRASVITLKPEAGKKRGHNVALSADIHDMGQRRTSPDPAAARQPARVTVPKVTGMVTKRLDNGLQVVLLPLNSVPTLDVRLVFASSTKRRREQEELPYLEPALTEDVPRGRWTIGVLPGYSRASYVDPQEELLEIDCCTGAGAAVNVGYAFDRAKVVGFHFAIATLRGHRYYKRSIFNGDFATELLPIDLGFLARFEKGRIWASVWLGLHLDRLYDESTDATMPSIVLWSKSLGIGLQVGLDIVRVGPHSFGVAIEADGAPGSASGYGGFLIGPAYKANL
jgi:predicted Zn-dependent peptidase